MKERINTWICVFSIMTLYSVNKASNVKVLDDFVLLIGGQCSMKFWKS